jgi:hypothetical protein
MTQTKIGLPLQDTAILEREAANVRIPVRRFIDALLAKPAVMNVALEIAAEAEGRGAEIVIPLRPGLDIITDRDEICSPSMLRVIFLPQVSIDPIKLKSGVLKGNPVSFGGRKTDAGEVDLAIIETQTGDARVTVTRRVAGYPPEIDRLVHGMVQYLDPATDAEMSAIIGGRPRRERVRETHSRQHTTVS